jgi:transcription elongation GreA/GreB family factor
MARVSFTWFMKKQVLIEKVILQLAGELELFARAAKAAHAEATDEQSKAENKYDTRGLEAAYLARGQSRQIQEIEAAIAAFQKLDPRPFAAGEPIGLGALVELEQQGERTLYLIGPRAGGTEITHDRRLVLVITPQSPLGEQLQGRKEGERLQLTVGHTRSEHRVLRVA